ELIDNLKVYEVVLKKDSDASKIKKEKYKSPALKVRKISSDEEESCLGSDEEYAMVVSDFKKLFIRRGKFIRQPYDDKKNLQKVKEGKKGKKERRCFKCGDPNHFISDCAKHFFNDQKDFSKDVEVIVKTEMTPKMKFVSWHLTTMSIECESCVKLNSKIESLSLKLARFENNSHFLQEMIENQTHKDKKGLGFIEDIASTSKTKTEKLDQVDDKTPTVEPAEPVPSTREPTSSIIGY
nr:serine/threonine protein kinase SRPK1 [Tanacetum cinerariifolium]GEY13175.1 serine/threonine protein kinase SRPK1 [Tanacetum cinerariifolium]